MSLLILYQVTTSTYWKYKKYNTITVHETFWKLVSGYPNTYINLIYYYTSNKWLVVICWRLLSVVEFCQSKSWYLLFILIYIYYLFILYTWHDPCILLYIPLHPCNDSYLCGVFFLLWLWSFFKKYHEFYHDKYILDIHVML